MNEEEKNNLAKSAVNNIIEICHLFGIDYFKYSEKEQHFLSAIYIEGARQVLTYMKEAREKLDKERTYEPEEVKF